MYKLISLFLCIVLGGFLITSKVNNNLGEIGIGNIEQWFRQNTNLLRPKNASSTILIGGTATTTNDIFQVQGNANITGNINASSITSPGSDTQLILNNGGFLGASANLTYSSSSNLFSISGDMLLNPGDPSGNTYLFTTCGGNCLTLQSQLSGNLSHLRLMSKDGDGTDNVLMSIHGVGTPANTTDRERLVLGWDKTENDYQIVTEANGTGVVRDLHLGVGSTNHNQLVLNANGFIGIATTTPSATLHIDGTSSSTIKLKVQSSLGQTADLTQWTNSTGTILSAVDKNGQFGIGTSTPQSTLDVKGTLRAGSSTQNYAITDENGNSWWVGSSTGMIYGSMYGDNFNQTVTVASTTSYYEIGGGLSGGAENLMTFQNAKEIKVTKAGVYKVDYQLGVQCASANQEIESEILVNGVGQSNTSNHTNLITANKPMSLGGTGLIILGVNDLVSLGVKNITATNDIIVNHANMTLLMVGGN